MSTIGWVCTIGAGAVILAGCATPSAKIANELTRFGLDQRQAACVGNGLGSRLSLAQLQQLARAARAYSTNDSNPRELTVGDLARASSPINDPQIAIEIARAAAKCGGIGSLLSR